MNTDSTPRRGARLQVLLVALVFAVPMVGAWWMYFGDNSVRPSGRTNHGTLLNPILNVHEEIETSPLVVKVENQWALVLLESGRCEDACRDALYKQRQSRLMLGNDMTRLVRVMLHGPEAPDTLFLEQEHSGLIALNDGQARQLLIDVHPQNMAASGFYLIDPLGNLVMYFPLDIAPQDLVDDIEHLLKLSRIG